MPLPLLEALVQEDYRVTKLASTVAFCRREYYFVGRG